VFVTKGSWRFNIELSNIIDNLSPASQLTSEPMMGAKDHQNLDHQRQEQQHENQGIARRKAAMAVLAHSEGEVIAARLEAVALPPYESLREAESGLVMVRGRIGGDGAPFNLGEATVSRAAVRLASGEVGFGYALGRDRSKAQMIALCDALVQSNEFADVVETEVIAPLRAAHVAAQEQKAAQAAATKVDFYTMVRGEG
jgi:alpha-D-ribose 1-methylphosphonate 5-triphosphate synthase subunit PhnG